MKDIRNIITGITRMEAITQGGVEYGTEVWHKRCTGHSTANALRIISEAMLNQAVPVRVERYVVSGTHAREPKHVFDLCRHLVDVTGLRGFTFNAAARTVECNVFEPVNKQ